MFSYPCTNRLSIQQSVHTLETNMSSNHPSPMEGTDLATDSSRIIPHVINVNSTTEPSAEGIDPPVADDNAMESTTTGITPFIATGNYLTELAAHGFISYDANAANINIGMNQNQTISTTGNSTIPAAVGIIPSAPNRNVTETGVTLPAAKCSGKGCRAGRDAYLERCYCFVEFGCMKHIHDKCYMKLKTQYSLPTILSTDGSFEHLFCTKGCSVSMSKLLRVGATTTASAATRPTAALASQPAATVAGSTVMVASATASAGHDIPANASRTWNSDSVNGKNCSLTSLHWLLVWLTRNDASDFIKYRGKNNCGKTKKMYGEEIANFIFAQGTVLFKRSGKDILNKIEYMEKKFKDAYAFGTCETGRGIIEAEGHDIFEISQRKMCPHYDVFLPIMTDRPSVKPTLTNRDLPHYVRSVPMNPASERNLGCNLSDLKDDEELDIPDIGMVDTVTPNFNRVALFPRSQDVNDADSDIGSETLDTVPEMTGPTMNNSVLTPSMTPFVQGRRNSGTNSNPVSRPSSQNSNRKISSKPMQISTASKGAVKGKGKRKVDDGAVPVFADYYEQKDKVAKRKVTEDKRHHKQMESVAIKDSDVKTRALLYSQYSTAKEKNMVDDTFFKFFPEISEIISGTKSKVNGSFLDDISESDCDLDGEKVAHKNNGKISARDIYSVNGSSDDNSEEDDEEEDIYS
jgi:hypothetical protein